MVGLLVTGYDSKGYALHAEPFDLSARSLAGAVGVKVQGCHHGWMICRSSISFGIVAPEESTEVKLGDYLYYEPDKMIFRQPVSHVRR